MQRKPVGLKMNSLSIEPRPNGLRTLYCLGAFEDVMTKLDTVLDINIQRDQILHQTQLLYSGAFPGKGNFKSPPAAEHAVSSLCTDLHWLLSCPTSLVGPPFGAYAPVEFVYKASRALMGNMPERFLWVGSLQLVPTLASALKATKLN